MDDELPRRRAYERPQSKKRGFFDDSSSEQATGGSDLETPSAKRLTLGSEPGSEPEPEPEPEPVPTRYEKVGEGGNGCVIRPPLECDEGVNYYAGDPKYVSKVIWKERVFRAEVAADPATRAVPGAAHVTVPILKHCRVKMTPAAAEILATCGTNPPGPSPPAFQVVMAYQGQTLGQVLETLAGGPAAAALLESSMVDLLGWLAAAHDNAVVHFDLKLANVLCDAGFHLKLIDFSSAFRPCSVFADASASTYFVYPMEWELIRQTLAAYKSASAAFTPGVDDATYAARHILPRIDVRAIVAAFLQRLDTYFGHVLKQLGLLTEGVSGSAVEFGDLLAPQYTEEAATAVLLVVVAALRKGYVSIGVDPELAAVDRPGRVCDTITPFLSPDDLLRKSTDVYGAALLLACVLSAGEDAGKPSGGAASPVVAAIASALGPNPWTRPTMTQLYEMAVRGQAARAPP